MLVGGKTVFNGVSEVSALERVLLSVSEFDVIELAAWTSDTPVSKVSNCCKACRRADADAELSKPERPGVVPGMMAYGCVCWPVQKIAEPATEVIGGNVELVFSAPRLSAKRPAQPVL